MSVTNIYKEVKMIGMILGKTSFQCFQVWWHFVEHSERYNIGSLADITCMEFFCFYNESTGVTPIEPLKLALFT